MRPSACIVSETVQTLFWREVGCSVLEMYSDMGFCKLDPLNFLDAVMTHRGQLAQTGGDDAVISCS